MMTHKDIFLIGDLERLRDDAWLVRGRAYEDLHVGGEVFADTDATLSEAFRIVSISAYGATINTLYSVMTGDLTLRGPTTEHLTDAHRLVRGTPAVDQPLPALEEALRRA